MMNIFRVKVRMMNNTLSLLEGKFIRGVISSVVPGLTLTGLRISKPFKKGSR